MSDLGMQTGEAIPVHQEDPISQEAKQVIITVAKDGKISMDFKGGIQTHEVFGVLYTSLKDLDNQNFVTPNLIEIYNGIKTVNQNVLDLSGDKNPLSGV